MNRFLLSISALALASTVVAQCTADFDFGNLEYGASPDAAIGEQFDTAYVDVAYSDVFHVLVPIDASAIDPAFALPLDSIIVTAAVLIADSGAGATVDFADVGLEIICNNGGASSNPCTFPGGGQYCADIVGTPTTGGIYAMSIEVQAYVTVFGVPVPQPYTFDGYVLTIIGPNAVGELESPAFTLFPNPAQSFIQLDLPLSNSERNILIRDLTGREVYRSSLVNSERLLVDVSAWNDGIYFVSVAGNNRQWTERLVISH